MGRRAEDDAEGALGTGWGGSGWASLGGPHCVVFRCFFSFSFVLALLFCDCLIHGSQSPLRCLGCLHGSERAATDTTMAHERWGREHCASWT